VKAKVTVRMSDVLYRGIDEALREEGLSIRAKSRWVAQALEALLDRGIDTLISEGVLSGPCLTPGKEASRPRTFTLEEDLYLRLVSAVGDIRMRDPYLPSPQSALVRAAILERLKGRAAA